MSRENKKRGFTFYNRIVVCEYPSHEDGVSRLVAAGVPYQTYVNALLDSDALVIA